jgi:DNA repair exonuclease SbcCD ATPase subunit
MLNDKGEEKAKLYLNEIILEIESIQEEIQEETREIPKEEEPQEEIQEEIQEENKEENQEEPPQEEIQEENKEETVERQIETKPSIIKFIITRAIVYEKQDTFGKGDPYVHVLYNGEERKTQVIKDTKEPEWNYGIMCIYIYVIMYVCVCM